MIDTPEQIAAFLKEARMHLAEEGEVTLAVRVRPGAPKSAVTGILPDGSIKVSVAAQPEDGKANEELTRFLATELGVKKNDAVVISGGASRRKLVRITMTS
jgi:uncharacterized protein (TIGR00251 family)